MPQSVCEKAFVDPSLSEKVMVKAEVEKPGGVLEHVEDLFGRQRRIHDLCRQVKPEGRLTHALS